MFYPTYTGSKPPPKWLGYLFLWTVVVPIMVGMRVLTIFTPPR